MSVEANTINKKISIFIIIFIIAIIASVSSVSAEITYSENSQVYRNEGDIANLNIDNCDVAVKKTKKENITYIRAGYKQKISLKSLGVSDSGDSLKIKNALWDFGDKTKKQKGSTTTHTYKKTGWYTLKLTLNASGKALPLGGMLGNDPVNTTWINTPKTFRIYVTKKPDLKATNIMRYIDSKKNVVYIKATIKNYGYASSKASTIKMWYNNKKLKKYTVTAKVPALKSLASTSVNIYFKIPYKYRNYVKYLQIDPYNKLVESIKSNNLIKF